MAGNGAARMLPASGMAVLQAAEPASWSGVIVLFLERPQVGDGGLDVVIRKLRRLHQGFVVLLHAFLDGFESLVVGERRLHGRVSVILCAELLAHLGRAFAIVAVAFGAVVG